MSLLQDVQKMAIPTKKMPNLHTGCTVKVHQKIKEGEKERIQIYEGLIIAVNSGHGADKTITVRKVVEGIGVEKIFPVYSPNIDKIEVKKTSKVRRAKIYFMRDRMGKSARLKETFVKAEEVEQSIEELAAIKAKEEAEKEALDPTTVVAETTEAAEAKTEE